MTGHGGEKGKRRSFPSEADVTSDRNTRRQEHVHPRLINTYNSYTTTTTTITITPPPLPTIETTTTFTTTT